MWWSPQVRSYVLHRYTLAKDLRTAREEPDGHAVLDGKLDGFLEEAIRQGLNRPRCVDPTAAIPD